MILELTKKPSMDLSKIMDTRVSSSTRASHKHPTISDFLRNFEMFSADARDKAKYREILD